MTKQTPPLNTKEQTGAAGAAAYNKVVLALYDWYVIAFSNTMAWRCPSRRLLDFYNQHITDRHLDVGVGTGYFLDRCRFPVAQPTLALLDLNPNSLAVTAKRLQRYRPTTQIGNVLDPVAMAEAPFASIGLNYLLHCLPGTMTSKAIAFQHLRPLLQEQGHVFGATILGQGVQHNLLGRKLMQIYNAKGIFGNGEDTAPALERALAAHFSHHTIAVVGCVALFVGRV
ncbi:MAG: class I SAM-dependent methyltransferase [Caldilineaceae bacterium]